MEKIKISGVNEELYYHKLNNGLELFVVPNTNQKNYYITYNTKFGSNDTTFKSNNDTSYITVPNGIAHYMEHLMFNMEDGDAFQFFSKLGASVNAFTTYDLTCYEVYSSTYFKENLNYLLDYVGTPYFNKKMIDNELGIISEEIDMYKNNPNTELTFATYRNIFINDNRRYLISGEKEDIKKITVDDIMNCYNTFYNPNNMFVVITGNVNPYEALAIIEENQKDKKFNNVYFNRKNINEPLKVKESYFVKEMNVEINKVSVTYKIPKKNFKKLNLSDEELYTYIEVLFDILFGSSSDINEKLLSGKIVPNSLNVNKTYTKDFIIVSLMTDSMYTETLINMISETMKNISINECDLERKIKVLKSNYILHFDNIESVNNEIQDSIINFNKFIDNNMDIYDSLNINKMNELIKCLKVRSESVLIIKPFDKKKK